MLREFDNYVLPGSEAWLMPAQDKEVFTEFIKTEVGSLKHLKLKFVEGDPTMPEALRKVASPDFAVAMVVADTSRPPDEADARTVISVLLLRDLFRHFKGQRPRIISEILDPRTKDLLEQDYGADFVVSAEMTSMLLAQVSERRELNAVFADLFDSDGNEIYLKRAACYARLGATTSWLSVQRVARQRVEVAIGYLKLDGAAQVRRRGLTEQQHRLVVHLRIASHDRSFPESLFTSRWPARRSGRPGSPAAPESRPDRPTGCSAEPSC